MKVMVFVKATPDSEAGIMPTEQLLTDMMKFNEELVNAGVLLGGEGLKPTSQAKRVHFSGTNRTVIDGPFAETKEIVAGYWLWQVKSLDEAVEWVKRCPNPMFTESDIDIRPVYEMEDFGELATPEVVAQEQRLFAEGEKLAKLVPRFETGKAMTVAGLQGHYTAQTRDRIPQQWQKFGPYIGKVPGQVGVDSYGVALNGTVAGDHCEFDYLCGVEVNDGAKLPAEFRTVKIPAGKYVVFTHDESVATLDQKFELITTKWLPNSGRTAAKSPWFERYTPAFNPQTLSGGIELWIPLEK